MLGIAKAAPLAAAPSARPLLQVQPRLRGIEVAKHVGHRVCAHRTGLGSKSLGLPIIAGTPANRTLRPSAIVG